MRRSRLLVLASLLVASHALAQESLPPPPGLVLDGVPAIPAEIAQKLRPYGEFRRHGLLSWNPARREMLVSLEVQGRPQVRQVSAPVTPLQPLAGLPDVVERAWYQPTHGDYFVFPMATGGSDVQRLYRHDLATRLTTPLSPEAERAGEPAWNPKGNRLAYLTVRRAQGAGSGRSDVHVVNPLEPRSDRVIARLPGEGWTGLRYSEDGRRLALTQRVAAGESHLWVMDAASGKHWRVTRAARGAPVAYAAPTFAKDGRGLFALSDRGSEFRRLVWLPLAGGAEEVLTGRLAFDVDDYAISVSANRIAFVTNEHGSHVLRFLELNTLKELPRPSLVDGVIGALQWRGKSDEVGFHIASARSALDVFSYDVKANKVTRWTNGNNPDVNTSEFPEPRIVKLKSFDGAPVSGLHYHPPARFAGKRPVIVSLHARRAGQARATFLGAGNHAIAELGIAMIFPNVRGSSGFGRAFAAPDDVRGREMAVRDIGALLDWIAEQPDLDAERVMLVGMDEGGYVALAGAQRFSGRIAAVLRATGGGADPPAPFTHAAQLLESVRRRGTVAWSIAAAAGGPGFAQEDNARFLSCATVELARLALLR